MNNSTPAKPTTPYWRTPIAQSEGEDDPRRAAYVDAAARRIREMTPAQLLDSRLRRYAWRNAV